MRRTLITLLMLATLAPLGGCLPADGDVPPPAPEPGAADFIVRLMAFDASGLEARRRVHCSLVGYAGTRVVEFIDTKTGNVTRYAQDYPDLVTPAKLNLYDYAALERIEIICTMGGNPGDELTLTVTTRAGLAANFQGQDRDLIGEHDVVLAALCSGTIVKAVPQ